MSTTSPSPHASAPMSTRPSQRSTTEPKGTVTAKLPEETRSESESAAQNKTAFLCAAATGVMFWASFTPLDFGPMAWVALIPLCSLIASPDRPKRLYLMTFLGGLVWSVPQVHWLRLASAPMIFAWAALATYMALYFPLFVGLTRVAVARGVSLPLAAGVTWAGLEYLRSVAMTGFPWYFIGHSQHHWTTLIQVADLGGAFLISALIASFAGLVTSVWRTRGGQFPVRATVTWTVCFAIALGYGAVRLSQADFTPGPRVALVQGNFPSAMKHDPQRVPEIFRVHNWLTRVATAAQPDLIVWPETMCPYPLYEADTSMTDAEIEAFSIQTIEVTDPKTGERFEQRYGISAEQFHDDTTHRILEATAARSGAAMLIGVPRVSVSPDGMRPTNSAVFIDPNNGITGEYDKIHRVPFGEYVPFVKQFPFLKFLEFLGPSLAAGEAPKAFSVGNATAVPLICFEDTVPSVARKAVNAADQNADQHELLVNMTNDGWFHGSSELDQHLITARFRSIETRTPMVRAVNTGISAVIDGNGVVRTPEQFFDADETVRAEQFSLPSESSMLDDNGRFRKELSAVLVSDVPLDPRGSIYLTIGDSFAVVCLLVCCGLAVLGWRQRRIATA